MRKKKSRFFIRNKKLNLWPHPLPFFLLLVLSVLSPDSYFRETLKLPLPLIDIQTIDFTGLRLTEKQSIIYGILWCTVMWHGGRQLPQHTVSTWMYKVHSPYTKTPLILFHKRSRYHAILNVLSNFWTIIEKVLKTPILQSQYCRHVVISLIVTRT